ncbi:hypothetical protein JMJ77_0002466, partial [Colletotrichum scovillei]
MKSIPNLRSPKHMLTEEAKSTCPTEGREKRFYFCSYTPRVFFEE